MDNPFEGSTLIHDPPSNSPRCHLCGGSGAALDYEGSATRLRGKIGSSQGDLDGVTMTELYNRIRYRIVNEEGFSCATYGRCDKCRGVSARHLQIQENVWKSIIAELDPDQKLSQI